MTFVGYPRPLGQQLTERLGSAAIIAGCVYSLVYLYYNNYLPFIFFYEPYDLFADWFNTVYWAYDKGTYDAWATLYPPLTFVFLRLLSNSQCYPQREFGVDLSFGLAARECDWFGYVALAAFFFGNIILVYRCLRTVDPASALPRTLCVTVGWPMLNGLERGNLVLVAFTCFVLAFGPLLRSVRLKWFFLACAINFKVYLIGAAIAPLLKRRWRWTEGALLATVIVYLATYALLGRGTLFEIVANLQNWTTMPAGTPLDMWSATTYDALAKLLDSEVYPIAAIIGSRNVVWVGWFISAMLWTTHAFIALASAATWLRPEAVPMHRMVALAVLTALISSEAGGYTPIFYIFLVMFERWEGFGRKLAIVLCFVIAIPADIAIDQVAPVVRDTFVGRSTTIITAYVKLSPFVRPALIEIVGIALACVTIRQVWLDVRGQGWRERFRHRFDAPLLPGVARPVPPARAA